MSQMPDLLSYQTPGARNSGMATATMVCGIVALMGVFANICCLIFLLPVAVICAVVSLCLGFAALGEIRRSAGAVVGRGFALTGIIYSTVFLVLEGALALLVVFAFLWIAASAPPGIPSIPMPGPPLPALTTATAPASTSLPAEAAPTEPAP